MYYLNNYMMHVRIEKFNLNLVKSNIYINHILDCNYTLLVDLTPNEIPFGANNLNGIIPEFWITRGGIVLGEKCLWIINRVIINIFLQISNQ